MATREVFQDFFEIRRAQVTEAIADCLSAAFAQHRVEYSPEAYADTVLNSDGVVRRWEEMCLFVAISDGEIVGTIGCMVNGSEGHLRGMAVLPDWQGTGVALALLQTAETAEEERLRLRNTGHYGTFGSGCSVLCENRVFGIRAG